MGAMAVVDHTNIRVDLMKALKQIPGVRFPVKLPPSAIALVLVGLVAGGGLVAFRSLETRKPRRNAEAMTVPVKLQDLRVRIQASGTVTPIQSVNISPKSAGRLVELLVDQGDRVRAGQVVARMEDRDLQARLAQAEATLAQAKARYLKALNGSRPEEIAQAQGRVDAALAAAQLARERRARNLSLYQQGAISRDSYDAVLADERKAQADLKVAQESLAQTRRGNRSEDIADAEAAVDQAEAQVQQIQVEINDTIIRAPFSGIITQKYASVGAFVTPTTSASATSSATSTSIVAIASDLEVVARVPETSVSQIRPGQAVEIQADAYPGKRFKGTVRLVAPEAVVDQNVTSFQVWVALQTGQRELKSGMNVSLVFMGDRIKNTLVVPAVAIVSEKGKTGVLVAGDGKPQFRPITIGVSMGDQTQVLQGLKPDDKVFVYLPRPTQDRNTGGQRGGGPAIRFR
jgi:HlyD family secretion protein